MDEQDRLWSVADYRIRQRQPIVLIGKGTSCARLLTHDVRQTTTWFSFTDRSQGRAETDDHNSAFICLLTPSVDVYRILALRPRYSTGAKRSGASGRGKHAKAEPTCLSVA